MKKGDFRMNNIIAEGKAKYLLKTNNANEIIVYRPGTIHRGIAGTEFVSSTMFIDYDNKKIAFLFNHHGAIYMEFALSENIEIDNALVWNEFELSSPGKTLTAFSLSNERRNIIIAFTLRMEDGSTYSIDNIKDERGRLGVFLDLPRRIND